MVNIRSCLQNLNNLQLLTTLLYYMLPFDSPIHFFLEYYALCVFKFFSLIKTCGGLLFIIMSANNVNHKSYLKIMFVIHFLKGL